MSVEFYNKNAEEFYNGTVNADMSAACDELLKYVPHGGKILDAGCGSGRDSLYFLKRGYKVVSIDASVKMVEASSQLTGQETLLMRFDEIEFINEFDGVWACASLLHVPKAEIGNVMSRLAACLKSGGGLYASFKYGNGETVRDGRLFNSYTEESLRDLMNTVSGFEVVDLIRTQDVRPGRESDAWVGCICRKK